MSLASRLRARITLESPQATPDDIGGGAPSWGDEGAVWAEIVAAGASDAVSFDGPGARAVYRVTICIRNDVRPGWRLHWGARILHVRALAEPGPSALTLYCEEEIL